MRAQAICSSARKCCCFASARTRSFVGGLIFLSLHGILFFKHLDEVRKMGEAECLRVAERHSIENETAKLASFSARPPQVR